MATLGKGGMRTFHSEEPLRANALLSLSLLSHLRLEGQAPSSKTSNLEGVHRAIAYLYRQGGLFDLAEKEYEEELRWNPLEGESRLRLGLYWLGRGDRERARQNLEVASRVRQDSPKADQQIGQGWLELADFPKAESSLSSAIQDDPVDPFNHQLLAEVYERTGRVDMAQKERRLFGELSIKTGNVLTDAVPERE